MTKTQRPLLREIFLAGDRQLDVFFHTSNIDKYLQARAVFDRAGLQLQHFRSNTEPYAEDYRLGKEHLLLRAVDEIRMRSGGGTLFFVEDTSLRIDALSGDEDFPGLAVKEWFADTSFDQLDAQLRSRGSNRIAVVKSDIALHVPGLRRSLLFRAETHGLVAATPPTFGPSAQYPWLTPNTFNGWLIPDGAAKRLGEMSLEESWKYDFRIASLLNLIDRLEEFSVVLNLSAPAYTRRRRALVAGQKLLWRDERDVFVVVGKTCAGKTTFGERAANEQGYRFHEASAVLRMLADGVVDSTLTPFQIAESFLTTHGADVVARKIVDLLEIDSNRNVVISGFRAVEEMDLIKQAVPHARVVLIEASERTRFERHLARGRLDGVNTISAFRTLDGEQNLFGLLRVAEEFADIKVENEGSLEEYFRQVDAILGRQVNAQISGVSWDVQPRLVKERSQTYQCLRVLDASGRPLTCQEIEASTTAAGHPIRYNNANKVLKRIPGLARRIESPGMVVRYEILNAGRAYLRYMDREPLSASSGSSASNVG